MENSNGYSAHVAGILEVDGESYRLSQIGPSFCILQKPIPHVACEARLVVSIDKSCESTDVYLPDGISADNCEVRFEVRAVSTQ